MDITGKVLREVEFRDRLRGYDTDEVDEFLEQVAVAIDDLHRQLAQAESRPESMPAPIPETQAAEPVITFDDDSIRRTLVLAQRTADLAIKEAKEEADRTLDEARRTAEDLVSQANATVTRLRAEADEEFSNRVSSQLAQREQLERDVRTLSSLVLEERERLADSLQTILHYVTDNLSISPKMTELQKTPAPAASVEEAPATAPPAPVPPSSSTERLFDDDDDLGLTDIEEIEAEPPSAFTAPMPITPPPAEVTTNDPDEELWQRWAQSDQLDEDDTEDPTTDPFGFDRRP